VLLFHLIGKYSYQVKNTPWDAHASPIEIVTKVTRSGARFWQSQNLCSVLRVPKSYTMNASIHLMTFWRLYHHIIVLLVWLSTKVN